jgi:EmrB/QacA subfamily drug resistance transporter
LNERKQRWLLIAMCTAVGLVMLDESAVAVVLTEIRHDLALSATVTNWVLTAYLISLSATVAACGRLADVIGLKATVLAGSLIFAVSSVGAGLADNVSWLVAFRIVQGIGAAAAFPAAVGMVRATTPPERLGEALGYFGLSSAIGLMSGPVVGGFLAEWLSWRFVFFLGVPLVLFIVVVTWWAAPNSERANDSPNARFDWLGLALLVGSLATIVGGLMQGPAWGWTSRGTLAVLGAGVMSATVFVVFEARRANPVTELVLFRNPTFLSANLTTLLAQFAKTSVIVYGPYYLIDVLGYSPLQAGYALLPGIVAAMFAGPITGRLVDRIGARKPVLTGLVCLALSLLYIGYAVGLDNYAWLFPGLVFWGIGATVMFAGSRRAVQAAVDHTQTGQASGINSTAQWLGAALSVPLLGAFVHTHPRFQQLYIAAAVAVAAATIVCWRLFENDDG